MPTPIDGICAAYLSGKVGAGFAMLVLKRGTIAGADALGVLFDGRYEADESGDIDVSLIVKYPANIQLIQGGLPALRANRSTLRSDCHPILPHASL
jgi:hypothetical protein